jgi:hypothetical protein
MRKFKKGLLLVWNWIEIRLKSIDLVLEYMLNISNIHYKYTLMVHIGLEKAQKAYNDNYKRKIELVKDKAPVSTLKKTLAVRTNSYTFLKRLGAMLQASS